MPYKNKKAYIIDDEEAIRILLSAILNKSEIKTENHNQINGAVEKAENFQADVIFLDLSLKDGSGFSIINDLKHVSPRSEIVIISAHTGKSEQQHAKELGVNYFLHKPLSKKSIFETLEEIFK